MNDSTPSNLSPKAETINFIKMLARALQQGTPNVARA